MYHTGLMGYLPPRGVHPGREHQQQQEARAVYPRAGTRALARGCPTPRPMPDPRRTRAHRSTRCPRALNLTQTEHGCARFPRIDGPNVTIKKFHNNFKEKQSPKLSSAKFDCCNMSTHMPLWPVYDSVWPSRGRCNGCHEFEWRYLCAMSTRTPTGARRITAVWSRQKVAQKAGR